MIENFLEFELWRQIVMGVLFVGGICVWIWSITKAIIAHKREGDNANKR